jgi:hypothetical protein
VVAIGSCPATTNVFIDSRTLDGPLDKHIARRRLRSRLPAAARRHHRRRRQSAQILAERGNKPPKLPSPSPTPTAEEVQP